MWIVWIGGTKKNRQSGSSQQEESALDTGREFAEHKKKSRVSNFSKSYLWVYTERRFLQSSVCKVSLPLFLKLIPHYRSVCCSTLCRATYGEFQQQLVWGSPHPPWRATIKPALLFWWVLISKSMTDYQIIVVIDWLIVEYTILMYLDSWWISSLFSFHRAPERGWMTGTSGCNHTLIDIYYEIK